MAIAKTRWNCKLLSECCRSTLVNSFLYCAYRILKWTSQILFNLAILNQIAFIYQIVNWIHLQHVALRYLLCSGHWEYSLVKLLWFLERIGVWLRTSCAESKLSSIYWSSCWSWLSILEHFQKLPMKVIVVTLLGFLLEIEPDMFLIINIAQLNVDCGFIIILGFRWRKQFISSVNSTLL